jgi:hypothetical protein
MDRKTFLQRFSMGAGAVILSPKIIASSIIKPDNEIVSPKKDFFLNKNEIFIRVVNSNEDPAEIALIGVNQNMDGNFIPKGVKIFIKGFSLEELNNAILYNPIRIIGFRMFCKNPLQLSNSLNIWRAYSNGRTSYDWFCPAAYNSAQSTFTGIDCPSFELLLTPDLYILNKINANEQVDYIFSIAETKSNICKNLKS